MGARAPPCHPLLPPSSSAPAPTAPDAAPFITALATLHAAVLAAATASPDDAAAAGGALAATDAARDRDLAALGVRLEDAADGGSGPARSAWSPDDPAALAAEVAARAAAAAGAALRKARAAADKAAKECDRLEKAAAAPVPAVALAAKYSAFDGEGNPTRGPDGAGLDEKGLARGRKEADKARKARAPYEAAVAADPLALEKARAAAVDAKERAAEAEEAAGVVG